MYDKYRSMYDKYRSIYDKYRSMYDKYRSMYDKYVDLTEGRPCQADTESKSLENTNFQLDICVAAEQPAVPSANGTCRTTRI